MYTEILHSTAVEILGNDNSKKSLIEIKLTPSIYEAIQKEFNTIISINTEVPIERITIESVNFYGRSVKLSKSNELNSIFEKYIVEYLSGNKNNTPNPDAK
ncbi:MAG: hypothetical protein M0R17_06890 [Candidatus Omnitrophica bacterium]|jgi:hypothetical protein|nr:hypothetical protein [Candidatus Omnitrophota bacterium]